jgi:molybdenum cofactor biosynthesis enzyme MoaA
MVVKLSLPFALRDFVGKIEGIFVVSNEFVQLCNKWRMYVSGKMRNDVSRKARIIILTFLNL